MELRRHEYGALETMLWIHLLDKARGIIRREGRVADNPNYFTQLIESMKNPAWILLSYNPTPGISETQISHGIKDVAPEDAWRSIKADYSRYAESPFEDAYLQVVEQRGRHTRLELAAQIRQGNWGAIISDAPPNLIQRFTFNLKNQAYGWSMDY